VALIGPIFASTFAHFTAESDSLLTPIVAIKVRSARFILDCLKCFAIFGPSSYRILVLKSCCLYST
jgi:hypothetical protein